MWQEVGVLVTPSPFPRSSSNLFCYWQGALHFCILSVPWSDLDYLMLSSLSFSAEMARSESPSVWEQENENEVVSTLWRGSDLVLQTESMSVHIVWMS